MVLRYAPLFSFPVAGFRYFPRGPRLKTNRRGSPARSRTYRIDLLQAIFYRRYGRLTLLRAPDASAWQLSHRPIHEPNSARPKRLLMMEGFKGSRIGPATAPRRARTASPRYL